MVALWAIFATLHYLRNSKMDPISQSVAVHYAKKAYQGKTLWLIGSFCNDMVAEWSSGAKFEALYFLRNSPMGTMS
jgi:hypothetical protein